MVSFKRSFAKCHQDPPKQLLLASSPFSCTFKQKVPLMSCVRFCDCPYLPLLLGTKPTNCSLHAIVTFNMTTVFQFLRRAAFCEAISPETCHLRGHSPRAVLLCVRRFSPETCCRV